MGVVIGREWRMGCGFWIASNFPFLNMDPGDMGYSPSYKLMMCTFLHAYCREVCAFPCCITFLHRSGRQFIFLKPGRETEGVVT